LVDYDGLKVLLSNIRGMMEIQYA